MYILSAILLLELTAAVWAEVKTFPPCRLGGTVTLPTGITGPLADEDGITWSYGVIPSRIAFLNNRLTITNFSERFRDRLQLDSQTGSLTITHLNTGDSGTYQLIIISHQHINFKFNISVYDAVSAPHIRPANESRSVGQSDEQRFSLECSVENNREVTLSWYQGERRLDQTSSLHSVNLTLPLVVTTQNCNNNYICVSENPVSNQTQFLDLQQLCPHGPGAESHRSFSIAFVLIGLLLPLGVILIVFMAWRKHKRKGSSAEHSVRGTCDLLNCRTTNAKAGDENTNATDENATSRENTNATDENTTSRENTNATHEKATSSEQC